MPRRQDVLFSTFAKEAIFSRPQKAISCSELQLYVQARQRERGREGDPVRTSGMNRLFAAAALLEEEDADDRRKQVDDVEDQRHRLADRVGGDRAPAREVGVAADLRKAMRQFWSSISDTDSDQRDSVEGLTLFVS